MERELWQTLYRWLLEHSKERGPRGVWYTNTLIAGVWLWAVLHERPVSWACEPRHWPADLLSFSLPSQSTLSRRLNSTAFQGFLADFLQSLRTQVFDAHGTWITMMDSKPLPVGAYSAAKDARWGQGSRCQQRGYKLHILYGNGPLPIAFEVVPMNASEQRVAKRLLRKLTVDRPGYVLADSVYDINNLYAIAAQQGQQLLAPRKCSRKNPGKGVAVDARHPARLRCIDLLEGPAPAFGQALYDQRTGIERRLSHLCSGVGGLFSLPPFVRGLKTVNRWVAGKLLIVAARWSRKHRSYRAVA